MTNIAAAAESDDAPVLKAVKSSARIADEKWGAPVMKAGFCLIPSILLRCQQRIGLNPTQLAVLLQLADFWWSAERKPLPE